MKYYSIRMKLDDVVKDIDEEQIILENVRRCSKLVGRMFRIIFWKLSESLKNIFVMIFHKIELGSC